MRAFSKAPLQGCLGSLACSLHKSHQINNFPLETCFLFLNSVLVLNPCCFCLPAHHSKSSLLIGSSRAKCKGQVEFDLSSMQSKYVTNILTQESFMRTNSILWQTFYLKMYVAPLYKEEKKLMKGQFATIIITTVCTDQQSTNTINVLTIPLTITSFNLSYNTMCP